MTDLLPLVSVFTGLHNIGARLRRTWESVVAQTYPRWEWVLVDDSTSSETAEVVAGLMADPRSGGRMRLLVQQPPPLSVGATKATAAGAAFGQYLIELDHDDELMPQALEVVAATFISHPDVDVVYSDWIDWIDGPDGGQAGRFPDGWGFGFGAHASEVIDGRRVSTQLAPPLTWETVRHIVATPNHVRAWRARFYHQVGGHDPSRRVADDYDLIVRSFLGGHLARIPRPLYVQHHDPTGSNTSRRLNNEIQQEVGRIAQARRTELDWRCTELGVLAAGPDPLCSARTLIMANDTIDVVSLAAADSGLPVVCVIVPTYRRPDQLRTALASVLAQDYPGLDVCVVGDGCPDIDGIIATIDDGRVRHANLAHHHGDGGASPRNFALRTMCRAGLVAYLDDDNSWEPNHVSSLLDALNRRPDAQFAFSSFYYGDEIVHACEPRQHHIDTSALLHRRSLLDRYGYWKAAHEAAGAHDWELVSRWHGEPWAATGQPTMRYTLDPARHSRELIETVRAASGPESTIRPPAGSTPNDA